MPQLLINLFGAPRIEVDGRAIEVTRRKAVALISYLAVTSQRYSRDTLATLLWPESSHRRSKAGLRSVLWELNKSPLKDWLIVEPELVSLRMDAGVSLDIQRFRDLLTIPQQHEHTASETCSSCFASLTEAAALYQGDFMAGFTLPDAPDFDEWQFLQTDGLRQALARVLDSLIQIYSNDGDFVKGIPYGRRYVALDPLHEPAHYALMKLYAQSGQQAAALRQYQICRETLEVELGIRPSDEITTFYEHLRRGTWRENESRQSQISIPNNLTPSTSPLIGRESELNHIAHYLEDDHTRLVTIVGAGGMGKTRLALAAAREEVSKSNFLDGIYFISLTPLSEPEAIMSTIAETVGYPIQSDLRSLQQQLFDYFSQKSSLLVLDNFEHLLAGRTFVAGLLQQAPRVKILATSREHLNLYEEQRFPLQGLAFPERQLESGIEDYAAAKLFLQCARRRHPVYEIAPADLPYLADICRLVEGLPLGLELAATWIEMLSLQEIVAEIQKNFDFLETDIHNIPDRHRSMRAVIDTSWQRLPENEQAIFARLSLFRGGFTKEAAEAVSGASLRTLTKLVYQSLLRTTQRGGRYEIHELLRQYGAEKLRDTLDEEGIVRDRHAAYFCSFLKQRENELKGGRQQEALAEIEADSKNAIAAWLWAVKHLQVIQLEQALVSLGLFYQWNGRLRDGATMCRLAVEKLTHFQPTGGGAMQHHLLVKLLTWLGIFEISLANYKAAEQSLQQAQAILADPSLRERDTIADKALLLLQLSEVTVHENLGSETLALNEQSLALYRSINDAWGITLAIDALSAKHQSLGNYDTGVKLQEECLAIRQQLDDPRGIARSYNSLGNLILFTNQIETSERYLRKSLALSRTMNTQADVRGSLLVLGINLLFGGKFEESISSFEACRTLHKELGIPHEPASATVGIARAKINLGRYEEAQILSETDLIRYTSLNYKWYIAFALFNLARIALVEGSVAQAQDQLQESIILLQEMNDRPLLPDVHFCLAYAYRQLGERQQASQQVIAGLKIAVASAPLSPMRFELPAMALLAVDEGQKERAVELYAAALQSPCIANSLWFETIVGREIAKTAATLPPDIVRAAEERGQARDLWLTANALLTELEEENG